MLVGPLVGEITLTFLFAGFLLHKYADLSRHHLLVTCNVFIAWYFSFIIIFVLPVDVSNTVYKQCLYDQLATLSTTTTTTVPTSTNQAITTLSSQMDGGNFTTGPTDNFTSTALPTPIAPACHPPWSIVPDGVLPTLWRIVYWTSQALTWIILPLMQSYSTAGDFTVAGKLKTALVENAIYYGTYLLVFGVLLIYVALKPDIHLDGYKLQVICVTASNTWGLFLLVLLLGYGLVEVPRSVWLRSQRGHMLSHCYFRASKLSMERSEAEDQLDDVIEEILQVSSTITENHPLREYMNVILEKCPEKRCEDHARRQRRTEERSLISGPATEKTLIRLHRQIIRALQTYNRTQCQWRALMDSTLAWEDVTRNEMSHERTFKHRFTPRQSSFLRYICTPTLEWYWKCLIRVWLLRGLTVVLALFSIAVVWSEMTFFTSSPTLSLFAVFFNLAKASHHYMLIELGSILTIAYLCVCAYYTVFKVRVFNYYYLAPHHQTDEYSLIFCGMMLCRLTPPLCLNVLGLIHLDSHVTKDPKIMETSYTKIMGHMDVISFISDGFNIYFPMAICLLCLATYFRLGSRLLHSAGFEQFLGTEDDITAEMVEEGQQLIVREKNRRQRMEDGEQRRRRFPPSSNRRRNLPPSSAGVLQANGEENARVELLQDVEPVDYTELQGEPLEPFVGDHRVVWQSGGRPRPGLFDDV